MHLKQKLFRACGILTVAVLWGGLLLGMHKVGFSLFGTMPLSSLGVMEGSDIYFSASLVLASVLLCLFACWLSAHYTLSKTFYAALIIGQLGQVIAAITPFGGEQPFRAIHTIAAFILAFSIPVLLLAFARGQKTAKNQRTLYLLAYAEIIAFIIGIGLFSTVQPGAAYCQVLPAMFFHVWLIYMTLHNGGAGRT